MNKIGRNLEKAEKENFDVIIVGSGIYGIMLSLEASRRNLKTLLLEKGDFGGETTLNHLKTVHGGLRYLQTLDIKRFMESVKERKWFLKYFPEYVNTMSCLMPLYGQGVKRNFILRIVLLLNDIISFFRNSGVKKDKKLPMGAILSSAETINKFLKVKKDGMTGSALWYDANISEFQRFNMNILHTAVSLGLTPVNYFKAENIIKSGNKVSGIEGTDIISGKKFKFNGDVVINASGPWSRETALSFDKDYPRLFKKNLLLWNILFDREALSASALGLSPDKGKGHTYFFHPWKGRLLIGSGEIVAGDIKDEVKVPENEIEKFIEDINKAVPGLELKKKDIVKIYAGLLPASDNGKLSKRPSVIDHSENGGPQGLHSISGVKFTTSRLVAESLIRQIFPSRSPIPYNSIFKTEDPDRSDIFFKYSDNINGENIKQLKNIIENESVFHLTDLILRRTSLGENPERALNALKEIKDIFPWDEKKWQLEKQQLEKDLR